MLPLDSRPVKSDDLYHCTRICRRRRTLHSRPLGAYVRKGDKIGSSSKPLRKLMAEIWRAEAQRKCKAVISAPFSHPQKVSTRGPLEPVMFVAARLRDPLDGIPSTSFQCKVMLGYLEDSVPFLRQNSVHTGAFWEQKTIEVLKEKLPPSK